MKILLLTSNDSPLEGVFQTWGDELVKRTDPLTSGTLAASHFDFLISHGYRHILRKPVLDQFPNHAINLHISLLPWNRGADPNFWSFLENTPKGVTIHHIDPGVDTGDIIAQREVRVRTNDTLSTSYARLQAEIVILFHEQWPAIRAGRSRRSAAHIA